MHILFLDQFGAIGGGQRSLLELLPLVRKRGWHARIALPGDGAFAQELRACRLPVEFIKCGAYTPARKTLTDIARFGWQIGSTKRAINRIVEENRIDLLYVNGPRLLPPAALVARSKSIPLIYHCHHRLLQPLAIRIAAEALKLARGRTIACCRFALEPLEPFLSSGNSRVIYNGVPPARWVRHTRDPVMPWTIGVAGRIEPEKGQLEFVAAARILASEARNLRFIVAGAPLFSGPEYFERVRTASRDLPIEFPGWSNNIGEVFARLDLLVVPSSNMDSTPRVVVEAFAGGVPVVAFPSGGIPEIVQDGGTGFLTSLPSARALASRIDQILASGLGQLREVADRAQEAWRELYTLDRFQEEVGDFIEVGASS